MTTKNFKKLRGKVDNYVGSIPGDISNIGDRISNVLGNVGTGKNISNFFDQRISNGLETLIEGSLGVRTSNIPEISKSVMDSREANRKRRSESFKNIKSATARNTQAPDENILLRYPLKYGQEDGSKDDFPNYIHFRSLKRRHTPGRAQTADGRWVDGKKSESDHDMVLFDIFLSLPDNLTDNLQVSYTEGDVGMLDQLIGSLFGTNDNVVENSSFDKEQIKQALLKMLPGNDLREFAQGKMNNPLKFNKFSGVPFRSYTYQFTLRPKNETESKTIRSIIRAFKRSMLPGVEGTSNRIWTFPNEWAIEYDGLIRDWVDFPMTCVCTSCDIDYTAGAGYAPTKDGAPQAITMSLGFLETTQLYRAKYMAEVAAPSRTSSAANGTNLTSEMQDELTNINDEIAAQKREVAQEVDNKVPKSYLKLTAPGGGR